MKVNIKEIESDGTYWIHLTKCRNKGLALLNTLMNPWAP